MLKITSIIKWVFILSFLVYVISVSWYSWNNLNTYFYFLKHISSLAPSLLFLFFIIKSPRISNKTVLLPFLFVAILSPYAIRGMLNIAEAIIFIQQILFIISCYVLSKIFLRDNINFTTYNLLFLTGILCLPPMLDLLFNHADFIYNSYYGRPRLLLGYYHPKEGGVSVLTVAILFKLYTNDKIGNWKVLFIQALVILLLYFMQSRNSLLFYVNFLLINKLLVKVNIFTIIFLYFILPIVSLASLLIIYFKEINMLTSNRLELWLKKLDFSILGKGSSIADFDKSHVLSKLHVDNFYLEYLIENGILFFIILAVLLFSLVFFIGKCRFNKIYINALYIPFLIFCFFDAGMFSSGNFLNLIVWSIVFASVHKKIVDSRENKVKLQRNLVPISSQG